MFYILKKMNIKYKLYLLIVFLSILSALLPIIEVVVLGELLNDTTKIHLFVLFLVLLSLQFYFVRINNMLFKKFEIILEKKTVLFNINFLTKLSYIHYESNELYKELYFIKKIDEKLLAHSKACISLIQYSIRFISYAFLLSSIIWYLGIVIFILLLLLVVVAYYLGNLEYSAEIESGNFFRRSSYLFNVLFSNSAVHEKTLFHYHDFFNKKWEATFKNGIQTERKIMLFSELYSAVSIIVILLFVLGIFWLIILIANNKMTYGLYASLFGSLLLFTDELSYEFSRVIRKLIETSAFIKQYRTFLNIEAFHDEQYITVDKIETIEFRNVSFGYDENLILKNCSFQLEKGKQYAIVGENGSGKTTLMKLLVGLLPYQGEIFVNNIPLSKISKSNRNQLFGVLFQDFNRYQMSIKENIVLGKEQEIKEILKTVGLSKTVDVLAQKENTILGKLEDGILLSAGEWQKIALARLLIRKNQCNIFDEPTASLDAISAYTLFQNLSEYTDKNNLNIFILQRLKICELCDEIFVLKAGEIIERGSFELLMQKDSYFKKMYLAQRGEEDV